MIIFVWFIGIQILGPDEQFFDQSGHSIIYNGTFTWKKSDGTKQNISVPGRYKVPAKQTMIITTTLPDDYNENETHVCSYSTSGTYMSFSYVQIKRQF